MASRSSPKPKVAREPPDANTTFVQADPATFRALVQKLTGAPAEDNQQHHHHHQQQQQQAITVAQEPPTVPMRRPKLQERRRAAPPRLELSRPHQLFYYYHHHHQGLVMAPQHSPVSPMDVLMMASSSSASPSLSLSSSSSMSPSPRGVVVISREEEEMEQKAIASKAFYLHSSPRGAAGDRPKLLPLFPVHSPRSSSSPFAS